MRKQQTVAVELSEFERLHAYHLKEAQRYADCIALITEMSKRRKKVDSVVDDLRAQADTRRGPGRPRKVATLSKKEIQARDRERMRAATRPIDHVRRLLAGGEPATLERVGIAAANGGDYTTAQRNRVVALVIKTLKNGREVKQTDEGFVATPKLVRALLNGSNGTGAEASA